MTGGLFESWRQDGQTLAQIGRALFTQSPMVPVRIPRALADEALAAWQREEDTGPLPPETPTDAVIRDRAATLALIGLSIENAGVTDGDTVAVDLPAWFVGDACRAADDAGLLDGEFPPSVEC